MFDLRVSWRIGSRDCLQNIVFEIVEVSTEAVVGDGRLFAELHRQCGWPAGWDPAKEDAAQFLRRQPLLRAELFIRNAWLDRGRQNADQEEGSLMTWLRRCCRRTVTSIASLSRLPLNTRSLGRAEKMST
jgi:hypothetical protein